MKSLDKKKTSELFEGVGSSLHQSFVEAVEREKEPKELDKWLRLTGETSEHFVTALQFDDEKSYKEAVRYFKESFEYALTQQRTELLEEIKGMKVGEFEGWDFFFGSIKKCCPGDDYADVYNKALKDFIQSLLDNQRQQILNLECLKEEKEPKKEIFDYSEDKEKYRNQLRKEIKEQINNLLEGVLKK